MRDCYRMRLPKLPSVNTMAIVVIFLLVGALLGGWLSSCQGKEQCDAYASIAGALGTWFGGLATAVAVLIAARQFAKQIDQQEQDRRELLQRERATALRHAQLFALRGSPGRKAGEVFIKVRNTIQVDMQDVEIILSTTNEVLDEYAILLPTRHRTTKVPVYKFGIPPLSGHVPEMGRVIQTQVLPKICVRFKIGSRTLEVLGKGAPRDVTDS